jgi:rhamnogalacturonyl hydrolase YesR
MTKIKFLLLGFIFIFSCDSLNNTPEEVFIKQQFTHAEKQVNLLLKEAEKVGRIPRTVTAEGKMHWTRQNFDWTEGFFPGTCWYLYEKTKNEKWRIAAENMQSQFENHKYNKTNHDLGFIFNSSYGNGYRITKNEEFKQVLITAGNSLLTRFNPTVGCIKSWDATGGWQVKRGWKFPVIIDNMMNLELLFELSKITGNDKYKKVAIAHANTTLKHHFRADNSSYHVVDYDPETGQVRSKQTAQGFSDESSWARGQAWGLYGYTLCFRYTKDEKYLEQAKKIADYITTYKGTPSDGIPYWDYNAPNIPKEPRDVSAAAITASALLELNNYTDNTYEYEAQKIIKTLATEKYTSEIGDNNNFILMHSVGSIPHLNEIDVPLSYADYYYIEALLKYHKNSTNTDE